jgi:hypothetical protein
MNNPLFVLADDRTFLVSDIISSSGEYLAPEMRVA